MPEEPRNLIFETASLLISRTRRASVPAISQGLVIIFYKAKCDPNYRYIQSHLSSDSAIVSFPLSVNHVSVLCLTLFKTDHKVVSIKLVLIMFYAMNA